MTPLSAHDLILDPSAYAKVRAAARAEVMPVRALRRIRVGDRVTLAFENAETLRYQTQEMVYVERITDPVQAAAEAETYARLLPNAQELCATFLVELTDEATVRQELARLRGLQHAFRIEVGGSRVAGEEQPGPDEDGPNDLTHSVHFIRFRFDPDQRDAFRDPAVEALLVADHPQYQASAPLAGETRLSLIADLNL